MKLPTLYKKNSKGTLQQWDICSEGNNVITKYGEIGGSIQTTVDVITEGKNIGKANETTTQAQALAEAIAKHTKKRKSGYTVIKSDAEGGVVDDIIEGGVLPMLAHSYDKHASKVRFPCYGQPKLDGIRCLAVKGEDGEFTLWSRTRKAINSCPHIIRDLNKYFTSFPVGHCIDGELYNHDYKDDFEFLVSAIRKDAPSEDSEKIQYHMYDCDLPHMFYERYWALSSTPVYSQCLVYVPTNIIPLEIEVKIWADIAMESGYEGLMLRNNGPYANKRSYDLQKVKTFQDNEFEIVGVVEGSGKLKGTVGSFTCVTVDGEEFDAKPTGDQNYYADTLANPEKVIGKMLTVKYQGLTTKRRVPRFPVGITVRDYE